FNFKKIVLVLGFKKPGFFFKKYIKKTRPSLTLIGLALQLFISKSQAYKLRIHFFEAVADELGMKTRKKRGIFSGVNMVN
ncbi:hypothetical protein ACPTGG_14430, partial [Enterococcus faecalis]